ncbi:MAG: glycosyltransferase [Acidimicrobiales bacterium]
MAHLRPVASVRAGGAGAARPATAAGGALDARPARLRVAIVTETWRPSVDGIVTRLDNTVRELRRAGHEVMVVGPSTDPSLDDVPQRRTPTLSLWFLYGGKPWALPGRVVSRALRELRPDVVHVVNPVLMGSVALRRASRRHPTVVSYHTDVSVYASMYHLGWARPLLHAIMRRVYRHADVRLATSEVGRSQLGELGVDDVVLWGRGVDLELFRPGRDGSATRARLCPDKSRPLVLYVGRLAREKGCERLLAVATSPGRHHVALVGDGPDRNRLEHLFTGSRATFTGVLTGDALADAYAAADVFVFPSETDTLGLVLLEAVASGLPVVATDSPAARAVLGTYPAAAIVAAGATDEALVTAIDGVLARRSGSDVGPSPAPGAPAARAPEAAAVLGGGWADATAGLVADYRKAIARRQPRPQRRIGRFLAVGMSNAAVDLGVFNSFVFVHPTRSAGLNVAYNTIAVLAAITNSYFWNSRWTFADLVAKDAKRWRQRALFLGQGGINLGVSDTAILGLSLLLRSRHWLPATLMSDLSKVVAMLTASAVSYVLMHFVVFRAGRPHPQPRRA